MREEFYENSVSPKNEKLQKIIYTIYQVLFVTAVVAFCLFIYLLMFVGDSGFIFLSVVTAIFGTTLYFIKKKLLIYYDYTFISGELRIVKIVNGKHRKKFAVIDCKKVFQLGKVGSESFEKLYSVPGIKKKVATPNGFGAEKQLYYVGVEESGEKTVIIMECEEAMLSYIVAYSGKNVIEKDYDKNE